MYQVAEKAGKISNCSKFDEPLVWAFEFLSQHLSKASVLCLHARLLEEPCTNFAAK